MNAVIPTPADLVEEIAVLRLPPKMDQRLQELMDRNTEGLLNSEERVDLEALCEFSERLSLVRARAMHLLGRKPQ